MNRSIITHIGVSLAAAGAGFGGGYILAKKRAERTLEEEIRSVKDAYYAKLQNKPPLRDLAHEVLERAEEELEVKGEVLEAEAVAIANGYVPSTDAREGDFSEAGNQHNLQPGQITYPPETDPEDEARQQKYEQSRAVNTFDTEGDDVAFQRNSEHPYLVSQESWGEPAFDDYDKLSLVYYVDDNTLTDESENIVEDIEAVVGSKNLTYFGGNARSGDDLIIYVRNEKQKADYEVMMRQTSYQAWVMTERPEEE